MSNHNSAFPQHIYLLTRQSQPSIDVDHELLTTWARTTKFDNSKMNREPVALSLKK